MERFEEIRKNSSGKTILLSSLVESDDKNKTEPFDRQFNQGMFFGLAQCLANGADERPIIDSLKAAGVTKDEVLNSGMEDFDMEYLMPLLEKLLKAGE